MAEVAREAGWDVIILTEGENTDGSVWPGGFRTICVPPLPPDPSHAAILLYWLRIGRAMLRIRRDFDVLHVHSMAFHQAGAVPLARVLGKPVLVRSSLSGEFRSLDRSRSGRLQRKLLSMAAGFAVLSERLAAEYRAAGLPASKLNLIPNGVDTSLYHPVDAADKRRVRAELSLPRDGQILIYHGVFMERKSIIWLVDVLEPHLASLDLTLVLVGGPARDEEHTRYAERLRERVRESRASDRILVRGHEPEVHRYLKAADAYVLPSTGEGLPNALLEAMATGLVPFATRTGGSEDVVEPGTSGFLFEPRDPCSLLEQLREVFGPSSWRPSGEIARAAARRVREHFSVSATGRQYVSLYEQLLRAGPQQEPESRLVCAGAHEENRPATSTAGTPASLPDSELRHEAAAASSPPPS